MVKWLVTYLSTKDLKIEIKFTLAHKNKFYFQWYYKSDEGKNKDKVKITIIYDTGCQKISSGRRYDSSSENSFIIGGIPKELIGVVVYSKALLRDVIM